MSIFTFPHQISPRQKLPLQIDLVSLPRQRLSGGDKPLLRSIRFHWSSLFGISFPGFEEIVDRFTLNDVMNQIFRQNGLKFFYVKSHAKVGAEDESFKFPKTLDSDSLLSKIQKQASGLQSSSHNIRSPNTPKRIRGPFDHQASRENILREAFVGGQIGRAHV